MFEFDPATLDELEALLGTGLPALLLMFKDDSGRLLGLMQTALADDDREQLRLHAHSLKGSSSNMGAMNIHRCCLRIEHAAASASSAELLTLLDELAAIHAEAAAELSVRLSPQA